jgi:hypothetical protein
VSERQLPRDETKQLAHAIRMVANPERKAGQSHARSFRIMAWAALLLMCGLVWTAAVYFAVGAPLP